ncbi:MAG: GGDEF domain-containing protein [Proteobacteria bacterium]|nr:GGDEF domain-containing protein [Pseudomonadota bacterium]
MTRTSLSEIDLEYARAVADRANQYMVLHGVAPTPDNFAVWFSYSRGDLPELKRKIDALIEGKKQFDSATSRELYAMHLAQGSAAAVVAELPEQFKSVMTEAGRYVTDAIADNRDHMQVMGDVADQANSGSDPKHLVKCLMGELSKASTRALQLQSKLSETSRELDAIRESLNSAEKQANTDTLTGLPNRRAFDEFLRTAQISAMNDRLPLGLMMIDIDHFKQFNDSFGHGVGDQVLRLIAGQLRDRLRGNDLPARYGGEELIAVLPGATLAVCQNVAERIRKSIADCQIVRRSTGETLPSVTVSIGIAEFRFGESAAEFVERCDSALYLAKRVGRNRVVTEARLEGRSVA